MPKAFISYSWTSKEHQQWVCDKLAWSEFKRIVGCLCRSAV
jgi:hypothetical protein